MEEQTCGLMLVEVERFSVQMDHFVHQPPKKFLVIMGIHLFLSTDMLYKPLFTELSNLIDPFCCHCRYYCRKGSTSQNSKCDTEFHILARSNLYFFSSIYSTGRIAGCFKLTSCDANTANQNIHAYGVILLVSHLLT